MDQDYFLFIDESGDHGLNKIDPTFPVFILCGTILSERNYYLGLDWRFNSMKQRFWSTDNVIFHSRDIRKWQKEFSILVDPMIRQAFFKSLELCTYQSKYSIIASAIQKKDYVNKYGVLNDVYSISLSFVLERVIFYLDQQTDVRRLYIVIEKRGKKEDALLLKYYNKLHDKGTSYVKASRFKAVIGGIDFIDKKDNCNGLQLSDLLAYPIATHIMHPHRANPAFDLLKGKFYSGRGGSYLGYGLKIFP